ncbi:MAG: carbohydrate kinase family protein [Clostridia bacterium]|nr:carbohydrate kinase family protein [Clostridia bacterium]
MASFVAVVGGINMDISGTSSSKMILGDSNPGSITTSLGGVGRNIAENLARLGSEVRMISALGDDLHGQTIRAECAKLGIDLTLTDTFAEEKTSTYLCINDVNGDVVTAIADMRVCERITPEYLETRLNVLNEADFVVIDANIPPASAAFLAQYCERPLVADTVSIKKADRLRPCLWRLHAIKPNRPEAELLSGVPIHGTQGLDEAADEMLREGVKNVFISLGALGVYYADAASRGIQPCLPSGIINTNGCGDAFLAASALALSRGHTLAEAALFGQASSSICSEAESAVSPHLTVHALEKRAGLSSF